MAEEPQPAKRRRRRMTTPPPLEIDEDAKGVYDVVIDNVYGTAHRASEELSEKVQKEKEESLRLLQQKLKLQADQSVINDVNSNTPDVQEFSGPNSPEIGSVALPTYTSDSPPPPDLATVPTQPRQINKTVLKALNKLEAFKYQTERYDPDLVYHENITPFTPETPNQKACHTVRVRFMVHTTNLIRVELYQTEPLYNARKYLAEQENVTPDRIELYVNETRVRPEDTFQSLNLNVADIVECYVLNELVPRSDLQTENQKPAGGLNIKVQSCKGQRDVVNINIQPSDTFGVLMEKYCELKKLDISTLKFQFDGENISKDMTAEDLDMEDGDCIDVI